MSASQSTGTAGTTVPTDGAIILGEGEIIAAAHDEPWTWQSVTIEDVYAARERIMSHLHRTPMLGSQTLSGMTGTELGLKCELFQRTGSFKSRGALNAVLQLSPEQRAKGVITLSAGNHGQGLAFAASMVGMRAVVFMPESAVPTKVEAIRAYGAETHFSPTMEGIYPLMQKVQREQGLTFVSPFSDPAIIAGQGVVGLEILEDMPEVETVVVPVGGGGLLAGVALAVKLLRPDVRVVGVEPEGANVVRRSLESGKPEAAISINTVADGLSAPFAGELSQAVIQHYVDDVVLLTEDEIINALRLVLNRVKVLVEPAGAASVAGLLSGKVGAAKGSRAVAILSGGNIDPDKLKRLI